MTQGGSTVPDLKSSPRKGSKRNQQYENVQLKQGDILALKQISDTNNGIWVDTLDTVIQINSTYVEFVDSKYRHRGFTELCAILSGMLGLVATIVIFTLAVIPEIKEGHVSQVILLSLLCLFFFIVTLYSIFVLKLFYFNKTHWPIRFNRKSQQMHLFRYQGGITSVAYDNLFFFWKEQSGYKQITRWLLCAYILDEDKRTILDKVVLFEGEYKAHIDTTWAFIQSYMELESVQELSACVSLCLPIADKKETLKFGFQHLIQVKSFGYWFEYPFTIPFALLKIIPRYLAMQSSTIPVWPAEIEAECQIEPNDPYQRDDKDNNPKMWRYMMGILPKEEFATMMAQKRAANASLKAKIAAKAEEISLPMPKKSNKELKLNRQQRKAAQKQSHVRH